MNWPKQKEEMVGLEVQENKKHKTNGEQLYDSEKYAEWLLNHIWEEGKYNLDKLSDSDYHKLEDFLADNIYKLLDTLERVDD